MEREKGLLQIFCFCNSPIFVRRVDIVEGPEPSAPSGRSSEMQAC